MNARFGDAKKPNGAARQNQQGSRARPHFRASTADDGALELLIYGDIVDAATISSLESWGYDTSGFVSALGVKKALDSAGSYSKVRVRINSPGGNAFEGMAIHSLLTSQSKPVEVHVDGIAASAASIVAMAGETRLMARGAMMMVHNAWASCTGYGDDMRRMGDTLDKVSESIGSTYVSRTGLSAKEVQALMDAETWLSAQDCVDQGFATAIVEPPAEESAAAQAMARRFHSLARMKNVPDKFRGASRGDDECSCDCEACVDGNCADCSNADCDDPNCKDCPMQDGGADNSIEAARVRLAALTGGRVAARIVSGDIGDRELSVDEAEARLRALTGRR